MLWHYQIVIFTGFITLACNTRNLNLFLISVLGSSSSSKGISSFTSLSSPRARMSGPETENTSLADLFTFMKRSEEKRILEMKALEDKLKDVVKSGVKEEINAAIEPIKVKQDILANDQSKLALKVLELEQKLSLGTSNQQSTPLNGPVTSSSSTSISQTSSTPSSPAPCEGEPSLRFNAVQAAKKILGFSKITSHHLQQAIEEHGLDPGDNEAAKVCAVYDFLYYEMKVPADEVKRMKVIRTFRPAKQPESTRLYAEFAEESSILLINRYVRNLQPDSNVDIWVPPSLYQRFRDFDTAAYKLRTGPDNVKTKVKYGDSDFILIKKSPFSHSWTSVIPDNLSPYNPNPPSFLNPSGSPPLGRNSRDKKRKTLSPSTCSPQRKKSFRSVLNNEVPEIEILNTIEARDTIENLQQGPAVSLPSLNC